MDCSGFSEHDISVNRHLTSHRVIALEGNDCSGFYEEDITRNRHLANGRLMVLSNASSEDVPTISPMASTMNSGQLEQILNDANISALSGDEASALLADEEASAQPADEEVPALPAGEETSALPDDGEEEVSVFRSFEEPNLINESVLDNIVPPPIRLPLDDYDDEITYLRIEGATQRGGSVG